MNNKARKFVVGLVTVAVVLAVYTVYSRISGTPDIDIDTASDFAEALPDANARDQIGTIGDVGVGMATKARYITRNQNTKQIEQVFGFETLISQEQNIWDVEKPYIHFYRPRFKCSVTADKGKVNIETAGDRHTLKGGKLTENIVIRIQPQDTTRFRESFIYLDDLVFVSERSHFSTAGPVRFASEDLQVTGTGLELVYNPRMGRVEYLRMPHVDPIKVKTAGPTFFGPQKTKINNRQNVRKTPLGPRQPTVAEAADKEGDYYRLIFSRHVTVDTGEQFMTADDHVCVTDIFWSKHSSEETAAARRKAPPGTAAQQQLNRDANTVAKPERMTDMVITCSNGILLTPVDSPRSLQDFTSQHTHPPSSKSDNAPEFSGDKQRTTLEAHKIDYSMATEETHITGPLELVFYSDGVVQPRAGKTGTTPAPVRVTAKNAAFLPASNQAVFQGDCICKMQRQKRGVLTEYTLTAPRITAYLTRQQTADAHINHLTAEGGLVRLASITKSQNQLVGGVELKCRKFDHDRTDRILTARGPGVIKIFNSRTPETNSQTDPLTLKEPCWAVVEDFETLTFSLANNQLTAEAPPGKALLVNYFPVDDQDNPLTDQQIQITAGQADICLRETENEQFELSTLAASAGVTYSDREKDFEGQKLFYDAAKSLLILEGDETTPCILNDIPVAGIEYNVRTGEIKADRLGPGTLGP